MFGKQFRENFLFPSDVTPLNHGSYGAVPKSVYKVYQQAIYDDLKFPDEFMFSHQSEKMVHSLKLVANLLNNDYKNLALVQNASSGINIVFRNFPFAKGDTIIMTSIIYGACGNTVDYVVNRYDLKLKILDIQFPTTEKAILARFESAFEEFKSAGTGKALSIYDTICSMPGVRMPFEKVTDLCKQYGITSCIDGAHSIGMLPIDIQKINPDFYTSNLHKWLYVPRGCAVLYVNPKFQDYIMPFPISHTYKDQPFYKRFLFYGSNNYNAFYCIEEALRFVEEDCGGFDKIREYARQLSKGLSDYFGEDRIVKVADVSGSDLNFMVPIRVPLTEQQQKFFATNFKDSQFDTEIRQFIENNLMTNDRTYIQFGWHNGYLYVRFSCQVYVDLDEYIWGYNEFEKILKKFFGSELYRKYEI
ncbi:DEKNAAC102355 [Brettanomyces naardenensis]|uniref:DEKNAAC102355 n=1 Tax=Brettanomyces naardenensis TaxID=13370 RepID=A0A448YK62_BRENA|nr:DEKNAAC102355 [Brettanomyces naardenensis]